MRVRRHRSYPLRHRSEIHRGEVQPGRLPAAWVEAREKLAVRAFDDSQAIGDVFDRAIAMVGHKVWRDKGRFRGIPCLYGTRIPLAQVCGMIAEGMSPKRVARALSVSEEEVKTALRFASIMLDQ